MIGESQYPLQLSGVYPSRGRKNMGATLGKRIAAKMRVHILGKHGPVAQLLHPSWMARNDIQTMSDILNIVDEELSLLTSGVKLVVTGGGYMEMGHAQLCSDKVWTSEKMLGHLTDCVRARMQSVATTLKNSQREFVVGVDVFDTRPKGVGQFAVFFSAGEVKTIAWKNFPAGEEKNWLAGFGTAKGRNSPRVVSTVLGKAVLLVCHDAQAYNHRNTALVGRACVPTHRQRSIHSMTQVMQSEKPEWVFNLIHQIAKKGSIKSFRNSYIQLNQDHGVPAVVGAFGYGANVRTILTELAGRAQYPDGRAGVIAILEAD
jgi:hypothetical protein